MGCGHNIHSGIVLLLIIIIQGLLLAALLIKKWIYFEAGSDDLDYHGSLFTIDKINSIPDYNWECLSVPACDADDDKTDCLTYKALHDGGYIYLELQVVNWALILFWMCCVIHLTCFKRDSGHPILNYVYPHLAWIVHLVAIIVWKVITEAKFEDKDECDNKNFDDDEILEVCTTTGPYIAIAQLFVQFVGAVYFTFVYYKRGETGSSAVSAETPGK
jgi:hypothetical protein